LPAAAKELKGRIYPSRRAHLKIKVDPAVITLMPGKLALGPQRVDLPPPLKIPPPTGKIFKGLTYSREIADYKSKAAALERKQACQVKPRLLPPLPAEEKVEGTTYFSKKVAVITLMSEKLALGPQRVLRQQQSPRKKPDLVLSSVASAPADSASAPSSFYSLSVEEFNEGGVGVLVQRLKKTLPDGTVFQRVAPTEPVDGMIHAIQGALQGVGFDDAGVSFFMMLTTPYFWMLLMQILQGLSCLTVMN
jgi:hypothetical protein